MRVGSFVFATWQGLGVLAKAFRDHGVLTDAVVIRHGTHETHEEWHPGCKVVGDLRSPRCHQMMEDFCASMDIMLFFETPFIWQMVDFCRQRGVKTAIMPMHECMPSRIPVQPDLWICPSMLDLAWAENQRIEADNDPVFLPIPVEVPWRLRTRAEVFVHNAGHGGLKGRNGTQELVDAVCLLESDAEIVIRTQDPRLFDVALKRLGSFANRVNLSSGTKDWGTLWDDGDVFVFPERFNGLSLPLQEACAAGMLVMATDRFPMNTWLPTGGDCQTCIHRNKAMCFVDPGPCPACGGPYLSVGRTPSPLIPTSGSRRNRIGPPYSEFDEAIVEPKAIAAKIDGWFGRDITEFSLAGKRWAEEHSWEALKPKYLEVLEELCRS